MSRQLKISLLRAERQGDVWVHHILQFLFSLKIYSTGVISASALWGPFAVIQHQIFRQLLIK